jgi:DNA-binding response OmpR family regulator
MSKGLILIVDDEPSVCSIIAEIVSDLGYQALQAADGRNGLDVIKANIPLDLLITDVGLPGGMSGHQLAEAARKLHPEVKIILMTAYQIGTTTWDAATDSYVLAKPFSIEDLAARICSLLT